LPNAKLVCGGVGIDSANSLKFTAHFAKFDLLNHCFIPFCLAPENPAYSGVISLIERLVYGA